MEQKTDITCNVLTDRPLSRMRKTRKDAGGTHASKKFKGVVLRQYLLNGDFVAEYSSIDEAVRKSAGRFSYNGIYNCVKGRVRKHQGYRWKCDAGEGVAGLRRRAERFLAALPEGFTDILINAADPATGETRVFQESFGPAPEDSEE